MVSIFQRVQYALSGTTAGRRFQEQMDVATVAMLTHFKALQDANPVAEPTEKAALFEAAVNHMEVKSFDDHKKLAQAALTSQMEHVFDVLVRGKANAGYKPSVFSITEDSTPAQEAKGAETLDEIVRRELGYSLHVRDSSIPGAGRGLFLEGRATAGTAIALYPGTVYLSEHYRKKYLHVVSNNPFARARFDGAIIDATGEAIPHANPLALAQLVNHPPPDTMPNVIPMAYDFPPADPFQTDPHHALIPNRFVHPPSMLAMFGKRALVHSLVLVALTDIEDEEVFLNYRYTNA
ncbi:hypothetical protein, variant [Aphanomyces astaci]|uniref:SET domain-containing protein n=1 Tax=Aphanomyces astaci TaxID=112090 RepID=W4GT44_APHAT|nr:hypothetical protein, variant [Aphanomyces astaci]ETV82882.1 hypothetical protein, variant [Aphanomyces astaci]|eukprot:XP_009827553.1 hypothetical protein, variant [Aphanomyces astaci]